MADFFEGKTADLIKKSHSKRGAKGTLKAKVDGKMTLAKARALKNKPGATTLDKKQANFFINMHGENKESVEIKVGNYQTSHFHMCGSAIKAMKKHANVDGAEELTKLQDQYFKLEKSVMDSESATDSQKNKAKSLHSKIMQKAKEAGIEKDLKGYMTDHLNSVTKGDPKPGFGLVESIDEDLRKWFGKGPKGDWVRMDTKGNIKGDCAREPGEGKPKCLPRQKAHSMSKKERATAARRKRRQDPVADRAGKGGKPVNVATEEVILEKSKPTNPALWSKAKSLAKSKFDVYPSAYANGWAAKWYKSKGGGWKTVSEGKDHSWRTDGHYTDDGKEWTGDQHAHKGVVMTGKTHTKSSRRLRHYKDLPAPLRKRINDKLQEEKLGKITRTPGGPKKFMVKVRDKTTGNVKTVRFGDPNLSIKRDDPKRRKSFRARHNCDDPGPRTKARYWSCKQWRAGAKVED